MPGPRLKLGQEATDSKIAEMCDSMYAGIRALLASMNPYSAGDNSLIQIAIQTRKQVHDYIMQLGKEVQSLNGMISSLASKNQDSQIADRQLLTVYYEALNRLYRQHLDLNRDLATPGVGAKNEEPAWTWQDSAEDQLSNTLDSNENFDSESKSYTFSRALLHQAILDNQSEKARPVTDELIPCAIILIGGFSPAMYQCTNALQGRFGDLVQIDPEQIATQIPECVNYLYYKRPSLDTFHGLRTAAQSCEEEVAHLLQLLLERSVRNRYNMLISGVGEDPNSLKALIRSLRKQKYKVQLIYLDQDIHCSTRRLDRHGARSGFCLQTAKLAERQAALETNIEAITHLAPTVLIYNNSGERPDLVWMREGKKNKIFNTDYVKARSWNFLEDWKP